MAAWRRFFSKSIGLSNTALMLMTGDPIDADKALAQGLISELVEQEELLPRARAIAETILSRAPIASETAKLNLRAACSMPLEKAMEYELALQNHLLCHGGCRRGTRGVQRKAHAGVSAALGTCA